MTNAFSSSFVLVRFLDASTKQISMPMPRICPDDPEKRENVRYLTKREADVSRSIFASVFTLCAEEVAFTRDDPRNNPIRTFVPGLMLRENGRDTTFLLPEITQTQYINCVNKATSVESGVLFIDLEEVQLSNQREEKLPIKQLPFEAERFHTTAFDWTPKRRLLNTMVSPSQPGSGQPLI